MAGLNKGLVIGLTGGIASGKSAVAKILQEMNIIVIDADQVARQIVEPGQPAWQEIVTVFGPTVLLEDGRIDRKELGRIIFADAQARKQLNDITHPRIRTEIRKQMEVAREKHDLVFLEIPLLIEGGIAYPVDEVWVVYAKEEEQLQRLKLRNNLTEQEAMERIHSQMPLAEKAALADRVIDNNGSFAELEMQVRNMVASIRQLLADRIAAASTSKGENTSEQE